ncbi:MAG TPA: 16S rRNA (adenine(1518)-N(6)/adenine(1519)-N(6))-dimethyltransferase RsmA [Planctomycetota bacterium]|nr:16S rRNA (adenine(1518)-N(6)/adenine(1519)-N(6))-dimethyltransferase RsmA [Planctomycetota bacterium]
MNSIQALLQSRGLSPRKIFGQNFMADSNFAAAIARDAKLDEHTLAIEAGPGTGLLTRAMLESHPCARVLAIEIDRGLAELLRDTFSSEIASQRLTLIEGDALDGKHRISQALCDAAKQIAANEKRSRVIVCANLPYNIATPFLANAALDEQGLSVTFALATIQLELAQRMLARPGDAAYGALSALLALRANGRIARRVGAEIFWPRPKVDSAVIELAFKPWAQHPIADSLQRDEAAGFQEFLKHVFSQRRKTLRALLKPASVPEIAGVAPNARAEALSPELLLAVFRAMKR